MDSAEDHVKDDFVAEAEHTSEDSVKLTSDDISPPRGQSFPIVGIGASAGGLEAFTQLLRAVPPNTGMAFVLVQHLDPHYRSQLTDLLGRTTAMKVQTVEDGMKVEPDQVYVIPENTTMVLEDSHLRLARRKPGIHLPIDAFFESLADAQGSRAIGIILSGNASDGSHGIRAIKAACGITFAQDETTAPHGGMPRNAIATGAIDYVLSPTDMGRELGSISRHPYVIPPKPNEPETEILPDGDGDLTKIFWVLQNSTNVDFAHYKRNTIRRRIGRRMIVCRSKSLGEYASFLSEHIPEQRELYRDLLISVTNFFRDPGVYDALAKLLIERFPNRETQDPIRVWVPGCATGEELYSLAILLQEVIEKLGLSTTLQLFGTDISDSALSRARSGIYPEAIAENVSAQRLKHFFTRIDSGYQISKAIREMCIFARQDLAKDPPFAHTDLISCRNVLIYMDSALQRRVLPVFHYSLNRDGLLVLGTAESVALATDLFSDADKAHHIYSRKPVPFRLTLNLNTGRSAISDAEQTAASRVGVSGAELQKKADRIIQAKYAPPAVIVDSDLQIMQFRGQTGAYLNPKPGEATLNLLRMAREELVVPLRRAIESASKRNVSISDRVAFIESPDEQHDIKIDVIPISGASPNQRYYLVVFDDITARRGDTVLSADSREALEKSPDEDARVKQLPNQLAELREYVRNLSEDHEAHEEELRAANEEVRSANEELQSTNEELTTAKEEVQSTNEELTTVNEEMQNRNHELNAANNDLTNILTAINVAVLMVDSKLRIRRFNSYAGELLGLHAIDIGRPVAHLHATLEMPQLELSVQRTLETLVSEQQEVHDQKGRWYALTVRPYRTSDDHIDGAVIVAVDITALKESLNAAEQARDYAESLVETVREPLVVLDSDLRVLRATAAFYETFHVSRRETLGRFLYDLGNGQWNDRRLRALLGEALFNDKAFQDYEVDHEFPHIGRRTMRLNAKRITREHNGAPSILLALEDVTKRQVEAEIRYRRLFETAKDGMIVVDVEIGHVTDVNPYFLELTGYSRDEVTGRPFTEIPAFQTWTGALDFMNRLRHEDVLRINAPMVTRYGRRVDTELVGNRYAIGNQDVIQVNLRDITDRKRSENALRESEERFRLFVESVQDYAMFQMDLGGRITTWNQGVQQLLGYGQEEFVGQHASRLFTPEDIAAGEAERELETTRATGHAQDERWHVRKDGSRFFASGVLTAIQDESGGLRGFAKIMRDVTERQAAEERTRSSLVEKETLLKEIHHRVKNNLQVITSLLKLQSDAVRDPQAVKLFDEMYGRVRSIAAIHEMLYRSDNLARLDFGAYLQKITQDLIAFYRVDPQKIRVHTNVRSAYLDITQAVPCGLIVNELITNSLKHAFVDNRPGLIQVSLDKDEREVALTVSDNGIGLPPEIEPGQAVSMGLQLVHLLVDQIQGELAIDRSQGTRVSIRFAQTDEV